MSGNYSFWTGPLDHVVLLDAIIKITILQVWAPVFRVKFGGVYIAFVQFMDDLVFISELFLGSPCATTLCGIQYLVCFFTLVLLVKNQLLVLQSLAESPKHWALNRVHFSKRLGASKRLPVNCTAAAGAAIPSVSICRAAWDQSEAVAGHRASRSTRMKRRLKVINNGGGSRAPSGSQALHLLLLSIQKLPGGNVGSGTNRKGKEQVHWADHPHRNKIKGWKCQEMLNFTSIVTFPHVRPRYSCVWVTIYQSGFEIKLALRANKMCCRADNLIFTFSYKFISSQLPAHHLSPGHRWKLFLLICAWTSWNERETYFSLCWIFTGESLLNKHLFYHFRKKCFTFSMQSPRKAGMPINTAWFCACPYRWTVSVSVWWLNMELVMVTWA